MPSLTVSEISTILKHSGENTLLCYLDELEDHFIAREPNVLAFVPEDGRFERLRREARELWARYPDPAKRPVLFGVPVGVKDIFHVSDFITRAGSQVPPVVLEGDEARSVYHLKKAGALIMGKTVTTEFAYFAPGPTRNPHHRACTPGGSSSGSAAAVGANICPLTLGTQTIGSITRPAAFCGVAGYKPTYNRISCAGVIPLSPSVDHVGVFARDVEAVALAAAVLVDKWMHHTGAASPRLGIPDGTYLHHVTAEGQAHFSETSARLVDAGFAIKTIAAMPDFPDICDRHNLLVAAEAAQVHMQWFAQYGELYHAKTAFLIQRGQKVSPQELTAAVVGREQLRSELVKLMDENSIDLWISPSAPGVAPVGLDSTGDPVMNLPWTHSGLPTIGLPSGTDATGKSFGLQLAARFGADEMLLEWAARIEEVLQ